MKRILDDIEPDNGNDDYSEMNTDRLLELERNLSIEYRSILKLNDLFNLDNYAEIIRELTIREECAKWMNGMRSQYHIN